MGANDAAEMLMAAPEECIRLEQENADLLAQVKQLTQAPAESNEEANRG